MKRTMLFLAAICCFITVMAQDYVPLVKSGNTWNVFEGDYGDHQRLVNKRNLMFKMKDDTLINSITYKKFYRCQDSLQQDWELYGFMRENTRQEKVWFRDMNNHEGLLYNFNVDSGQKVIIYNPEFSDTTEYHVMSRGFMHTQLGNVKIIALTDKNKTTTEVWIEGMGSLFGPLSFPLGNKERSRELLCFTGTNIRYVNPKFGSCQLNSITARLLDQDLDTAVQYSLYRHYFAITAIPDMALITFKAGGKLPNGLVLDYSSGLLYGIPMTIGTFRIVILLYEYGYFVDSIEAKLTVTSFVNDILIAEDDSGIKINFNPSENLVFINCSKYNSGCIATIYDVCGRKMLSRKINENSSSEIYLESFAKGLYLISLTDQNSGCMLKTGKLIVN
jgi:hypothetical protein